MLLSGLLRQIFCTFFLVKYKHINTSSLNLYSIFLHFFFWPGSLFFWIYWSKTPSHLCPTKSLRGLSFPILRVLPSSLWLIAFAALMLSWEAGLVYVQTLLVPCCWLPLTVTPLLSVSPCSYKLSSDPSTSTRKEAKYNSVSERKGKSEKRKEQTRDKSCFLF